MIPLAPAVLLLAGMLAAQGAAPVSDSQIPQRKQLVQNQHVTISLLELAPQASTPMHRHDHDIVTISISGGHTKDTLEGKKPDEDKLAAGEVHFRSAGFTHALTNEGPEVYRAVIIEFAEPQGKTEGVGAKNSHYCNPGSKTACVDEKYLFCTNKVCLEDVSLGPGAVTIKHGHATEHMLIAVSDYELTDDTEGKGTTVRTKKSGEVEYFHPGITHQLKNTGRDTARFIAVVFR